MAIPGNRVAGKNQKVRFNTSTVYSAKFNVVRKHDKHDITSGEDNGDGTWAIGVRDVDVTIEAFVDINNPIVASAQDGAILTNVILYPYAPNGVAPAGTFFTFPLFVAEEMDVGAEVRGVVNLRIKGSNQGTWTGPTNI